MNSLEQNIFKCETCSHHRNVIKTRKSSRTTGVNLSKAGVVFQFAKICQFWRPAGMCEHEIIRQHVLSVAQTAPKWKSQQTHLKINSSTGGGVCSRTHTHPSKMHVLRSARRMNIILSGEREGVGSHQYARAAPL
jgi:hypothetical protein